MTRSGQGRASERARWLAALSSALDEAQGVLAALDEPAAQSTEAHHLRARVAALKSEVEQLRRGSMPGLTEVGKKSGARSKWPGWTR